MTDKELLFLFVNLSQSMLSTLKVHALNPLYETDRNQFCDEYEILIKEFAKAYPDQCWDASGHGRDCV